MEKRGCHCKRKIFWCKNLFHSKCFSIKKNLNSRLKAILVVLCLLVAFSTYQLIRFCQHQQSVLKKFKYQEMNLKYATADRGHLSKYIVRLKIKEPEKVLSVPLMGGLNYCIRLYGLLNGTNMKRLPQVEAFVKVENETIEGLFIYFYTNEGLMYPPLFDLSNSKMKAMLKYAKYYDISQNNFNLSFIGPFIHNNGGFILTPTYIPHNYRVVIATDYLTAYYFEDMVDHYYNNKMSLHIIYILPMECVREIFIEIDRSAMSEPCYLLQWWARLSNRTGRGVTSKITLQAITVSNYLSLHNSSLELDESFYNVWTDIPPWWSSRVLVYSSHAYGLGRITDGYIKVLNITDYFKVNCLEIYEENV